MAELKLCATKKGYTQNKKRMAFQIDFAMRFALLSAHPLMK